MKSNIIDIYVFSGTGNTLLVVRKIRDIFAAKGLEVNLFPLDRTNPKTIDTSHTIGLGFPVAEQGTYPFVWNFVRALPQADGTEIFMIDTMLAYSGGVVGPMRKIVQNKGYKPIGALEIPMPNNYFPRKLDKEKNNAKIKKGLEKAEQYAHELINSTAKWGRIPGGSDIMATFSQMEMTWNMFRKMHDLRVDKMKCTKCGLCVKLCPIENIQMAEYPVIGENCYLCMRCVSFCPSKAITKKNGKGNDYRALKASDMLEP